jgi:secretion/DNA translocation related CpaE-like protein
VDEGAYAAVLTADEELLDRLLTTLAAVGLQPQVVSDPGAIRSVWREATVVAVGGDRAERLAELGLPRRPDVFVVGDDADSEQLCRWSIPLGAAVAPLPSSDSWFAAALADAVGCRDGDGRLVAVVAASGGVGASTCAAALAVTAAEQGQRTMLLDGDPWGGGLDLLLGAEHAEGWRWPRLMDASGHLGDLTGQLPHVDGVDLLAAGRRTGRRRAAEIGPEQLASVLGSAKRSHDLIVIDLPRCFGAIGQETLRRATLTLLIARADLRGLAAARELVPWLPEHSCQVVLRSRRPRTVGPDLVEESLGLPVVAALPDEAAVRSAGERGEPPSRSARSPLSRACRAMLDQLPPVPVAR